MRSSWGSAAGLTVLFMASDKPFIPYHPGAVKFFKEKGVWTKEMDSLQAKLLSE